LLGESRIQGGFAATLDHDPNTLVPDIASEVDEPIDGGASRPRRCHQMNEIPADPVCKMSGAKRQGHGEVGHRTKRRD
jgi:hypothetical protein